MKIDVLDTLKKARQVIVERGDVARNSAYRDGNFTPARVCSIGAMRVANGGYEYGLTVMFPDDKQTMYSDIEPAVDALSDAIGGQAVDDWNDMTESVDEVLEAFDRAIAEAEKLKVQA